MKKYKLLSLASTLGLLPIINNCSGHLVDRAGLTKPVAFAVIGALSSGGLYAASLVYPPVAPFLASAKVAIAIMGTSAAVAF